MTTDTLLLFQNNIPRQLPLPTPAAADFNDRGKQSQTIAQIDPTIFKTRLAQANLKSTDTAQVEPQLKAASVAQAVYWHRSLRTPHPQNLP